MRGSRASFSSTLLFALLAITVLPRLAGAQDMPPILAPLAAPHAAVSAPPVQTPIAEATIPPAVVAPNPAPPPVPVRKQAAAVHAAKPHHDAKAVARHGAKFATLMKRFAKPHPRRGSRAVAARAPEADRLLPPGAVAPPPAYYPPPPYQRLVYGGPSGPYGGWGGFRGGYPYYP